MEGNETDGLHTSNSANIIKDEPADIDEDMEVTPAGSCPQLYRSPTKLLWPRAALNHRKQNSQLQSAEHHRASGKYWYHDAFWYGKEYYDSHYVTFINGYGMWQPLSFIYFVVFFIWTIVVFSKLYVCMILLITSCDYCWFIM